MLSACDTTLCTSASADLAHVANISTPGARRGSRTPSTERQYRDLALNTTAMHVVAGAGVMLGVDAGSGAQRLASEDHKARKPESVVEKSDVNLTCIYPVLDV